jgi:hypothetical protein
MITQFQQLERLLCTGGAGAQHGIDRDALFSEVVAHLLGMAFAVRGESPLAVPASGAYVLGFSMTEYEQDASLVHPSSLRRRPLMARAEQGYDVPFARSKSNERSRSFCVMLAARANSAFASSFRPSLANRSPRTLGSR